MTSPSPASASMTGMMRRCSSAAETGSAPGRVDSPPTSMIAAPSVIIRLAWASATSSLSNSPPSEKLSGVTFKIPIRTAFPPRTSSRSCARRQRRVSRRVRGMGGRLSGGLVKDGCLTRSEVHMSRHRVQACFELGCCCLVFADRHELPKQWARHVRTATGLHQATRSSLCKPRECRLRQLTKAKRPPEGGRIDCLISLKKTGAGEAIRTLDPNLGKVVLYP